jgi:CDGSH iron-sulfur domain-containing protein 3
MEQEQEKKNQAAIEVNNMGPIKVTGNFIIKDIKRDAEYSKGEFILCGCGKSANKPFCDDSHKK